MASDWLPLNARLLCVNHAYSADKQEVSWLSWVTQDHVRWWGVSSTCC